MYQLNLKMVIFDLWHWRPQQNNWEKWRKRWSSHFISSYFLGIQPVKTDVKQISNIKCLCYMNSKNTAITNKHRKRRDINNTF